jgi:ATP-dependent RNA helicase DeaD
MTSEDSGNERIEAESGTTFEELGLNPQLVETLHGLGYEEPTPIQIQAIPLLLQGQDVLGSAATGTGKTAAFALPMIERLEAERREVQGLVLAPTRELAVQVSEAVHKYGRYRGISVLPVYGGQPIDRQLSGLRRGVQVVVGTPGRLLDHIRRGTLKLGSVRYVVLDEADEMLDMGFIEDIEAILDETPKERQTALFSATFPPRIAQLAERHLRSPTRVMVRQEQMETPLVRQVAYTVARPHKLEALGRVLDVEAVTSAIIFCRTRTEVDELTEALAARGYRPEALHGGLTQAQRDRVMGRFREGTADLLIATDVAARGLDVEHVSHVINYDIPQSPEVYVHRIGRTGRAGREGTAITLVQPREHRLLKGIERLIRQRIEPARIPTIADLRARRLSMLRASLQEALVGDDYETFRGTVEGLAEQFDVMDIAAAAVKIAAEAMHGDSPEEERDIPQWDPREDRGSRDREERGPRGRRDQFRPDRGDERRPGGPMTRLFLSIGRRRGIRPADLVGAISNEANIPGRAIGSIEITDQFTLVEVPESLADQVIQAMSNARIKGRSFSIRRDRS